MPEIIGRYQIKRELGRGGMATVYLAFDPRFQRDVAIKLLPRQFTHDPRFLARFEQEAQTIAALEDPAIVPVYDFGEHDDAPYLVMRYLAGGTLRERVKNGPLTLAETSRILNRLAPALDVAHQRGVIHRDLKPDNVLFDEADRPYLADFGIARMAEATHTMTIIGTPAYMSPEQVRGQQKLDGRSDIYALGVMLFEMLAGIQPYQAETPSGQMFMHAMEPVPDILAANPGLPPSTQGVIDRAMAKDREERYQTAVALANGVQQLPGARITEPSPNAAALPHGDPQLEKKRVQSDKPRLAVGANEATRLETLPQEPEPLVEVDKGATLKLVGVSPATTEQEASAPDTNKTQPAIREGSSKGSAEGSRIPAWAWWGAAVVTVLLLAFGIRALAGDDGGGASPLEEVQATAEVQATEVEETAVEQAAAVSPPVDPELGAVWERPQDQMEMVYVPSGTFSMGSENGDPDEAPVHEVTLDGFWIDRAEVTNAQYNQCVNAGKCEASRFGEDKAFNGDEYPVVGVDWHAATGYCHWVGGQLPTEAQWEYVARGLDGNKYPWGEQEPTCNLAQYGDCAGETQRVGSFPDGASWIGAWDLAGNVWEWVNDWYGGNFYANSGATNPEGPESGDGKILRGGSWSNYASTLRPTNRLSVDPTGLSDSIGFRCLLAGD